MTPNFKHFCHNGSCRFIGKLGTLLDFYRHDRMFSSSPRDALVYRWGSRPEDADLFALKDEPDCKPSKLDDRQLIQWLIRRKPDVLEKLIEAEREI